MQLSEEESEVVNEAFEALSRLNNALRKMREMKIACNIRESGKGHWLLDASAIIMKHHSSLRRDVT